MRKVAIGLMILLCLSIGSALAQGTVRGVVVNEYANLRFAPALGADLLGTVPGGWAFVADARSPDNEWLRVDFNGSEAWIHVATLKILGGDINSLRVADPRSIPYGGFESPRAGMTSATSAVMGKLVSGLRLRAGPSTAYPVLADIPRFSIVPMLGRTAANNWVQVNYLGTLGWVVYSGYIEPQDGHTLLELPIDGIVADALPISQPTADDYMATLKLMRARLDLAQPALDAIRAAWADSALTGRAFCHSYPARPSGMTIPNQLLAAFYPVLYPLNTEFNDAMANVRHAIDLFIEACNYPGTTNPVGTATVQGALDTVNLADSQFAELRRRLAELIPPDQQAGEGQCMLVYQGEVDILPVVPIGGINFETFDSRRRVIGACFDVPSERTYNFEVLQTSGNAQLFISVSPLDNPTAFLAVGEDSFGNNHPVVGPALISDAGRYLIIVSDSSESPTSDLTSQFAYAVIDVTNTTVAPTLQLDVASETVTLSEAQIVAQPGTDAFLTATEEAGAPVVCQSLAFTCNQLFTCEEARACLAAGNFSLDPDGDGVPCEENLCVGQ